MFEPGSQVNIIKALLVQCGGSACLSRDALEAAARLDLEMRAGETGITLTVRKPDAIEDRPPDQ